jgi:hypothetical protein
MGEGTSEERPSLWTVEYRNKHSLTEDKGWSSSLGVGRRANSCAPQKHTMLRNNSHGLGRGRIPCSSEYGHVTGACECDDERSGCINWGEFLD